MLFLFGMAASTEGFSKIIVAASCSPDVYRLGGAGLGPGTTGKLGLAWVCAWHWCMGVGEGLDGDGEEVVSVVMIMSQIMHRARCFCIFGALLFSPLGGYFGAFISTFSTLSFGHSDPDP